MANIVQQHVTQLQYNKALATLKWLDYRFIFENIGTHEVLLAQLLSNFHNLFTNLKSPLFKPNYLKFYPNTAEFNDNIYAISSDISTLFKEIDIVEELLAQHFNYADIGFRRLINEVQETQSLLTRFTSMVKSDDILVGQDSFDSIVIMDRNKLSGNYEAADIIPDEGVLTLKRLENVNVMENAEVSWKTLSPVIEVTGTELAKDRFNKDFSQSPVTRHLGLGIYEGLFYGKRDAWRPEGDNWHIVSSSIDLSNYVKNKGKLIIKHTPLPTLEDLGANIAELQAVRSKVIDGNPDTFWEAELLLDRYEPIVINGIPLTEQKISSADIDTSTKNALRLQEGKEVTHKITFKGELVFKLKTAQVINWVSLKPHNFGQPTRLLVKSISTLSNDSTGDANWKKIDDFVNNARDIVLDDKTTQEMNREEIFATLSPDKNSQLGTGIWTFAPRKVQQIKFVLEQDTPYFPQYEVIAMSVGTKKGDNAGQQGFSIVVPVEAGVTIPIYVQVDPDIKWSPNSELFYKLPTIKGHKYRVKSINITGQQKGVVVSSTSNDNAFLPGLFGGGGSTVTAGESSTGRITATMDGATTGENLLTFSGSASAQTVITIPYADQHEKLTVSLKADGPNPITFNLNILFEDAGFKDQETTGENATPAETQFDVKELSYMKSVQVHLTGGFENMATGAESVEVGQEYIANWWWRTKQDKIRYAIGVREVGAFAYKYNEIAEFVSQPFHTPYPLKKVALSVQETIPEVFLSSGNIDQWVEYYISVDDTTWTRILPLSRSATNTAIPKFLYIASNSILNSNEVSLNLNNDIYQTRLRIILKRPGTGTDIAMYTPIVRKFAIQMFT